MEFRYRAVDGDRPPTATDTAPSQSTNPDFSFFTARPMLGCNRGASEDHVRAEIQREIEKEQIRQEIIAAERGRRRELIAEVVQEMAMERVMAIRRATEMGMTQDEKLLTMWINQRKLPNQNHNIDPLMYSLATSPLMQMPEAIGAKATSTMESNKDKLIVLDRPEAIGAKRKAEEAPSAAGVGLNEHVQGKSHEAEKMAPSKRPCSAKRYKFWCDICGIGTFSQTVMRNHELGRKHMATVVKQQNEPSETSSTTAQKVDEMAEKETEGEKKKKVTFTCETCNIRTYSEKVMETHKLGKKHKALLENKPIAVLDTKLITVPVSSLNADLGEKSDKK